MLTRLPLRVRIFLFFCLIAAGATALAGGALYLGWTRGDGPLPAAPFVQAFLIFAFLNTGLALVVWLLFDENVAKPIDKLAADLRLRAHSGIDSPVDTEHARYLGDLAGAASAVSSTLGASVTDTAALVERETERLTIERAQLTALLTEVPLAMILLNPAGEIALYDGQAAGVLSRIAPPRLKAPLTDYFDAATLDGAMARLKEGESEVAFVLPERAGGESFDARLKPLDGDCALLIIDAGAEQGPAPRPLVFDFDLLNRGENAETANRLLSDLCFVVFDTETTGLSIEDDDIVQIGAARVLNARIVEGETLDRLVNPGRPIPAASTRIHKISDADVAGAPDFRVVAREFHDFARDAVLVAHNAPFDIGLLRKSEAETGIDWTHPVVDTVLLSAVVFGTNEEHSLDALCRRLSIELPEARRHTALGDAEATAAVLVKLLPLLEAKGLRTFGDLVGEMQKHGRLLKDLNA